MVKIPLLRRQPKPDSSPAEDDGSREAKSAEVPRAAEQPPVPQKDSSESAAAAAKGKRIPFTLKPREHREEPASPEPPQVQATVSVTPPETRREERPAAPAAEHASPAAPAPGTGLQPGQFVIGTDKKIPFPKKPPAYDAMRPRTDGAEAGEKPSLSKATVTLKETSPAPPAAAAAQDTAVGKATSPVAVIEKLEEKPPEPAAVVEEAPKVAQTPPPPVVAEKAEEKQAEPAAVVEEAPKVAQTPPPPVVAEKAALPKAQSQEVPRGDALAILRAMPDFMFLIGPKGVEPALGDGGQTNAAPAVPAGNGSASGLAAEDGNGKPKPLGTAVLEELARQHEQHTKKALEARLLQVFQFQVRCGNESHDMEARLTPLSQTEVLALVRDVTDKVQRHNALIESRNELENHLKERNAELIRVNKMLKGEVGLRGEQEEILKKNFHRLERLLEDTIGAITMIVQERDPHVADHQRRVSQLACAIGQDMKLRNDQMRAVRMAALLHDLGKIFIPAEILRKPGKLTPAEMSVVKTHPDTDYRILKRIDFPISIADVVRQHHERMDGSGYPQGLKGDSILLEARILAVADVIEGMVFERPYRVAPGIEAALKEIAENKGTLYDTAVAETCLKLFAEERFKFEPAPAADNAAGTGLDRGGQDL